MTTLGDLQDLRGRLNNAELTLGRMAEAAEDPIKRAHLNGKANGISLAISYVSDLITAAIEDIYEEDIYEEDIYELGNPNPIATIEITQ